MTIVIETPSTVEEAIKQKAVREGLSVQEYVLRVLLRDAVPTQAPVSERARQEARERIASGIYAKMGLSSEEFMAERSEEARHEAAREAR